MGDGGQRGKLECWSLVPRLCLLVFFGELVLAQIKYSIPEEVKGGARVGNIAKDLGLDVSKLLDRRLLIVSGDKDSFLQVNQNNGILYVHKKIDREEICNGHTICMINLKIAIENPLEIHYVAIEILDINDNSPVFPDKEQHFEIAEQTALGTRFQIQAARDPDVGTNSVQSYRLIRNENFEVDVRNSDEEKMPFLVLRKSLDREQYSTYNLILMAMDGGNPPRSGTLNITVNVLDSNDNRPLFSQDTYSVTIPENVPNGTVVIKVNASDRDDGTNGEIEYSFVRNLKRKVYDLFDLDHHTGEIRVKGEVNFEDTEVYKLDVQAADRGQPPLTAECRVIIKVLDVNDNKPEIEVTSLLNIIPENAKPGTVISLVSVTDKDSGFNGKVLCKLSDNVPFELKPSFQENMYSLVTKLHLDREQKDEFDIMISATDLGEPPLSTFKTLSVQISDINDNCPEFTHKSMELYIVENNAPGVSIFSVSASDKDLNENADLIYQILENEDSQNRMASLLNINSETGIIYALKSFDFETLKTFQFHVLATDSGTPPLSSNVTVNVFILDQNDNIPVILYPVSSNGSADGVAEIPRNVNAGHLVKKIRAYDADIGYNGWLLFSLQEVSDHTLFGLDRYTGQIRTLRSFTESDKAQHKLIVYVKDNGNVSLSATATVTIEVVEPKEAFVDSGVKNTAKYTDNNYGTFYLIITLGSVSALFFISVIVLIVMQCSKSTDNCTKYLQNANYDGTLCHSIQYRSGDKRYMLVGSRMSIGSTLVPDHRRRASGEVS